MLNRHSLCMRITGLYVTCMGVNAGYSTVESAMERRTLPCLLIALAWLTTRPEQASAVRDCLQCWRDVCDPSALNPDGNFQMDCCSCVLEEDSCITNVTNADTTPSECCNIAQSNLLSVFSTDNEPSNVCNSSEPFPFIQPTELQPVGNVVTLLPGVYVVPSFEFECSGCIEEVQLQGKMQGYTANSSINVTVNLMTWSRLQSDYLDDLYRLSHNVSVTTDDIEGHPAAQVQLVITFTLSESSPLCFEKNETLGFSFEENSNLTVILVENEEPVYELTPSIADTCPNLGNLYSATRDTSGDDRIPLMVVRVRPPSVSSSVTLSPSSLLVTSTVSTDFSSSSTSAQADNTPPSDTLASTPTTGTTTTSTMATSAVSSVLIVGVVCGFVAFIVIVCATMLVLVIALRRSSKDKVDGSGRRLSRVRSLHMDRRLQQNSRAELLPVRHTGEPFYDYPHAQVHPYHELEGPPVPGQDTFVVSGNYTTMQPAGSVRDESTTSVANGSHTMRSIYDDDLTVEHVPSQISLAQRPLPPVQDTPFYHVLVQPGEIDGQMVTQIGYDDPVELTKKQGSKEEIVKPIYKEIEAGPQQHLQMIDPSNGHPYHILDNNAQSTGGVNNAETVEEQGLYVPTAEERRRIRDNTKSALSASDVENWIKKNRAESTKKRRFFESTSTYWNPPSDADSLYNTLAKRKYREILSDQIQIVKFIGSGQFGTVNLAVWKQQYVEPMEIAVKVCRAGKNEAIKAKFLKEAAIMGQFRHPNVVKLYGVVTMAEVPMIVLELMKNGDMLDYMKNNFEPGRLPPPSPLRLLSFSRQVACGMEYLSNKAFVHRDLAARNILLNELHQCKIGDFGMARDLEDSEYYIMSRKGPMPLKWTAPEALHYRKYSTFSDCYSYGMVLYEIWSVGREPLPGISIKEVPDLVTKGFCQAPPPGCPRAIYELMVKLWNTKKRQRPTFPEIVEYLKKPEEELLAWSVEDRTASSQAAVLGAPLEEGHKLYPALQNAYQSSWC